jgi:hypothetical protein
VPRRANPVLYGQKLQLRGNILNYLRSLKIVTIFSCFILSFGGCAQYINNNSASRRIDLAEAVIVVPTSNPRHTEAAEMLQEEIEKRTGIRLALSESKPETDIPTIVLGTVKTLRGTYFLRSGPEVPSKAEGYAIWVDTKKQKMPVVYLVGRDDRGALFAAGRLIRVARMRQGNISIEPDVQIATAPKYPLRGHMCGSFLGTVMWLI